VLDRQSRIETFAPVVGLVDEQVPLDPVVEGDCQKSPAATQEKQVVGPVVI